MNVKKRKSFLRIERDELVYNGKFTTVTRRHFTNTRSHKKGVWEIVTRKGAIGRVVGILGITPSYDAILVKVWRVPLQAWVIQLCYGGAVEREGESNAALREFQEETGYIISQTPHLLFAGPFAPGIMADELAVYVGFNAVRRGRIRRDSAEDIEVIRIPLDSAPKQLTSLSLSGKILVDVKVFGALYAAKNMLLI